jgi:2-amino-4-hydroxy-6-hydroxymethyldihydropteridine diphosphokinase
MDCYVALGSNLGDRARHLRFGLSRLAEAELAPLAESSVWETEPVGIGAAPWFWNMAVKVASRADPFDLLRLLLEVERAAGRVRGPDSGSRTLDLDLLLVGDLRLSDERLTLPHPRMWSRGFVLAPLAEIAPDLVNPASGRTVAQERRQLAAGGELRRLGSLARQEASSL